MLARRADLILLDEPNAGLDAGGRERYLEAFAAELHRGAALVTATHDIGEAIEYDQVLLLARRVVALGPGREVLTPDRLMETFGIVIRDPHAEHAGRFTVAERTHGAPQILDLGLLPETEPTGPGRAPGADGPTWLVGGVSSAGRTGKRRAGGDGLVDPEAERAAPGRCRRGASPAGSRRACGMGNGPFTATWERISWPGRACGGRADDRLQLDAR